MADGYAGSKAALAQISETIRSELSPLGVKVVSVMTGAVSKEDGTGPNEETLKQDCWRLSHSN